MLLSGHDHHYERFAKSRPDGTRSTAEGIRSFVVGSGGKNHYGLQSTADPRSAFRDATHFGVLRLVLDDDPAGGDYGWSFVDTGGTVRDSGPGSCRA